MTKSQKRKAKILPFTGGQVWQMIKATHKPLEGTPLTKESLEELKREITQKLYGDGHDKN